MRHAPARPDSFSRPGPDRRGLFCPPTPPAPTTGASPASVPRSLDEARRLIRAEALEAATPSRLRSLPPEDRADVLLYAAEQADQAVALFDQLHEVAQPMDARELRHLPPEDAQAVREQAVQEAWDAYHVLAADGLPGRIPARASARVERALAQTEALIATADRLSPELQQACLERILQGTDGLEAALSAGLDRALQDRFPTLEGLYGEQSRRFSEAFRAGVQAAGEGLLQGDSTLAREQLAALGRLAGRLDAVERDVRVLARFRDAGAGLDAFGIALDHDADVAEWTDAQREQVLAQAIRIENALRAADSEGRLTAFAPGQAFDALFAASGDVTLRLIEERNGCNLESLPVIEAGAITCSSGLIEYRTFSSDQTWDGMANSRQYHIAHEFGHALNASISSAYTRLDEDNRSPYQVIDDASEGLPDPSQRAWDDPAWGIPARETEAGTYRSPYQQNATASNSEYFADVFANWANGTLLDNEAGRALEAWMERMAPEWIRARLEASQATDTP